MLHLSPTELIPLFSSFSSLFPCVLGELDDVLQFIDLFFSFHSQLAYIGSGKD
jgi:hypothetical protein